MNTERAARATTVLAEAERLEPLLTATAHLTLCGRLRAARIPVMSTLRAGVTPSEYRLEILEALVREATRVLPVAS